LDRVSKASSRPFVAIVTAAARNYLENPAHYKPHVQETKLPVIISVRVSRGVSDFFLDEAFVAPISRRSHLLGLIVGIFLRRYPYRDLVTALHSYADVIGPILRGRKNDRQKRRGTAQKDPGYYQTW
jgi:hypothetical protein